MKNSIRELRKDKKYRQEDLAMALGVTRQTINAIENDKYDPTLLLALSWQTYWERRLTSFLNLTQPHLNEN